MNIKEVVIGILLLISGTVFVWKTEWFFANIGRINFFEEKMGVGSSRFGYKLIGILLILVGTFVITGLWGKMFLGVFGKYFGGLSV